MSIYILVKWSLFQIKDRGETKNIANKHLFRLTAASCNPLPIRMNTKELIRKLEQMTELSESRNEFYKTLIHSLQNDADQQVYDKVYSNLCGLLAHGDLNNKEYDLLKEVLYELERV